MKQPKLLHLLRMALVLALFCSFATSMAYDFEVDGIYYNKTSDTTVEVTYYDYDNTSYSGDVIIPSTITHNGNNYVVTAIGERAFWGSGLANVTIPGSITSIGYNAFCCCYNLISVTCYALNPPRLSGQIYDGCLSYGPGYGTLYCYYLASLEFEYDIYSNGVDAVLYVPAEVYNCYSANTEWTSNFTFIAKKDAGQTTPPTIITKGFNEDAYYYGYQFADSMYVYFEPGEDSRIFIGNTVVGRWESHMHGSDWCEYENGKWFPSMFYDSFYSSPYTAHCTVYAFAVAEGKAPSPVVVSDELSYSPENIVVEDVITQYDIPFLWGSEEYGDEMSIFYDAEIDGIYYVNNNGALEVVQGMVNHCIEHRLLFASPRWSGEDGYEYDECHYEQDVELLKYKGDIVIPEHASGEGSNAFGSNFVEGDITSIGYDAFKDCIELLSVFIPNTVKSIGSNAFNGCGVISRIIIPTSVNTIGNCCFTNSYINDLCVIGEGAWPGCSLDVAVFRMDIDSDITAISGMTVNPREIYCYSAVPPICDENTFTDYTGTLHVPESSLAAYFTAPYWCNFLNIVGDAVELDDLSIDMQTATLEVGCELNLSASVLPDNASVGEIEWTSSNDDVATVVDGVVTAKSKGECDIVATCLDKRAICHLTVTEVLPSSITLNQESVLLEMDSTFTLTALIAPENSTYKSVTWTSSDTLVATVSVDGVVTATGVGETEITASCKDLTAVCHVKVLERFIYITLDHHRESLLPNHILTLTPTVSPVSTSLVVTSSNPSVAAARLANGLVQVVGVAPGSAVIKVGSTDGNAFADSCFVTVYTQVGDVNCDGFIKINDVTAMIDYIFGVDLPMFDVGNADVDFDGRVTITDITVLIDLLLTNTASQPSRVTYSVNGESFTMIRVAPGSFMMGATEEQGDDYTDREKPVHEVTLTSSYFIGETEVTQALWLAVMGTNPSKHTGDLNKPVENVTWPDCQEFITRLNALTGEHFRLPTEAEWEFAARGGNKSHGYKYAGSNNVDDVAWYTGETTHAVAMLQPNELYLYDMSGNVDEWVNDYWYTYTSEPQTDPTGPESGTSHVYRGGSWYGGATASRVSCRMFRSETFQRGTLGLRLAL